MTEKNSIDRPYMFFPLIFILIISASLVIWPKKALEIISLLQSIFVDRLGSVYIVLGLFMLFASICIAFSKYGNIRLGRGEEQKYSTFKWGTMIFTSTMAADILYWSLIEWAYYYNASPFGLADMTEAVRHDLASAYPLFHWGPIPWSFYILPACAYAYLMFVKGHSHLRLSDACRPVIGHLSDGILGRAIDIFSAVGLLAGIATTFSAVTPLLSGIAERLCGITATKSVTIVFLLIIGICFSIAVLKGMKSISRLAGICVFLFVALLVLFFACSPKVYIIESGISAVGTVMNDFFKMSTWLDPLRISGKPMGFPQEWTVFYWAYWVAWFVATPFFIAKISEGRTVRSTIIGGLGCGMLGTWTSFIVFGGYGLHLQSSGKLDIASMIAEGIPAYKAIIAIFDTLPLSNIAMILLLAAMIAFYSSTLDAITIVMADNSIPNKTKDAPRVIRIFWAVIIMLLPMALIFSEETLPGLKAVSIIAAFPLSFVMICVTAGFIRQLRS